MAELIKDLPETLFASFEAHTLTFRQPSGTSRGVLTEKKLWIIHLWAPGSEVVGRGECSIIAGLSPDYDDDAQYEEALREVVNQPLHYLQHLYLLADKPSILFGLETAFLDWQNGGRQLFFENAFTRGESSIPINGLIWMGDESSMQRQIDEKLAQGFGCIKMKVGAIDFEKELDLLKKLRDSYPSDQLVLRVDANGAFGQNDVHHKLEQLAALSIHSIEQPIAVGQHQLMKELCEADILPIALDEELIPIKSSLERNQLLEYIKPHYIILKPSLHGGLTGCNEWISIANRLGIPWWITSALESNIGLTAIAQYTGNFQPEIPQGLGTGGLFTSNFDSSLVIRNGQLFRQIK